VVDDGAALLDGRPRHAGEGRKRLGAHLRLGALRDLAGNHGRPQRPLGAVVGRLDARVVEEAQQVAARMMPAQLVQQALVVGVGQRPLGQVVVQGMAAGKPVVATDGGALPEIVLPGKTGLLVSMGDPHAMADAISRLLADPAWARSSGTTSTPTWLRRQVFLVVAGGPPIRVSMGPTSPSLPPQSSSAPSC